MRYHVTLAVLTATLLVAAPPADTRLSADTVRMKAIAAHVWHDPCAGQVHIRRIILPNDEHGRPILGRIVSDANGLPEPPCRIRINSRYTFTPAALCTLMIHEYGHLAGWRAPDGEGYQRLVKEPDGRVTVQEESTHHRNPRKIMYPSLYDYGDERGGPHPRCRAAFGRAYRWQLAQGAEGGPTKRTGRVPRDGSDHPHVQR